jgi:phospholipid/cholesterol/gamma-HCH transport system substrate-binding protein
MNKKDWIGRALTMEVIVGGFIVMVFLGLGYFTIILSREAWWTHKEVEHVLFRNVMGLRKEDNVVVRGMPIGRVSDLRLDKDGVEVTVMLQKALTLRKGYRITVAPTSMLGGRQLEVYEGPDSAEPLPPGEPLHGEDPYNLMSDASKVINAARQAMIEGGVFTNLQVAAQQIRDVITRLSDGQGTLGKLLSPDDSVYKDLTAGAASFKSIGERLEKGHGTIARLLADDDTLYKDLSAGVTSLKGVAERLEKGQGTLGKLLSADDTMYKDLSSSVASLKSISGRLEKGEGTLGRLLSTDDGLYKDLAASVASLKDIAQRIEKGEGSIGRLMKDEALYNEVKATVSEARAALDDYRETSPVVTFTSIFFGAF